MTPETIIKRTILLAGAMFALLLVTTPGLRAACSDPAAPDVDWNSCDLSGTDLYDVDLSRANLEGANLTGANLTKTYLMYSNLTGANLTDANLTNTVLASATWTDGRKCVQASVGACN